MHSIHMPFLIGWTPTVSTVMPYTGNLSLSCSSAKADAESSKEAAALRQQQLEEAKALVRAKYCEKCSFLTGLGLRTRSTYFIMGKSGVALQWRVVAAEGGTATEPEALAYQLFCCREYRTLMRADMFGFLRVGRASRVM